MFRGKIFLTNIKASDLPWTSTNRTDLGSELRPYLVISVDAVEKKRVRCEESQEDQIATNSPDWSDIFVQIPDLAENIDLQFTVYHNSDITPHLPVAHLDMDIATLKESMDRGTTAEQKYNENFPAGGSLSFMISMKEDQAPNSPSKVPQRMENVTRCFPIRGHKFKKYRFREPTFCRPCGKMIWGITEVQQNGLKCDNCKMACHRRCYNQVLIDCPKTKAISPEENVGSRVNLNNPHVLRDTRILIPKICQVHMQYIRPGRCMICINCDTYVHLDCRDLLAHDCGVNTAELSKRLEKHRQDEAKRDAEREANQKMEDARVFYEATKRKRTIKNKERKIGQPTLNDFEMLKVLGQGSFGKVILVTNKKTKTPLAMKTLRKEDIIADEEVDITMTERNVLALGSQCRFMASFYCSFQTVDRLFFVMEYLNGGDLYFHILNDRKFSEERTRFYCAEIILAFLFLHSRNIVYRDLKLDNVMLTSEGHVKLTDFGMCKENISAKNMARTFCGTPHYIAPEIIKERPYSYKADFWSLGVLTYEMRHGFPPFDGNEYDIIYKKIVFADLKFKSNDLSRVEKDFMTKLLVKSPEKRLGGENVKSHPFFDSIDWEALAAGEVDPPFVPKSGDPLDTTYFETKFTGMDINFSIIKMDKNLTELCETSFPEFSFYAGDPKDLTR